MPAAIVLIRAVTGNAAVAAMGKVSQVLLMSLLYGGVPYAALALWATWWVGRHTESEVRALMFRAPILMGLVVLCAAVAVGYATKQVTPFVAVGVLGLIMSIIVGYGYVMIVVLLREAFGPQEVRSA